MAALHDPRLVVAVDFGRVDAFPEPVRETVHTLMQPLSLFLVACNPPDHTRLRALLNKGLTPHAVEAIRGQIQAQVDQLLGAVVARADPETGEGRCDLLQDFAYPLPANVIAAMLGLPPESRADFRTWSTDLSVLWGPTTMPDLIERVHQCERSVVALRDLFGRVIAARRVHPESDVISALLAAGEDGRVFSDEELLWNCVLLLLAGHETTMDLIGNGLLALLRHPAELRKLQANASLIPNAVEELLRYDAPFQFMQREAREPVTINGMTIPAGQRVWIMLGAANRDPAIFPDPDRLDVTRPLRRQIAFGSGIHFCPGLHLARLEGQLAFTALLRRFADIRLASDKLEREPKIPNRGLKALPISFRLARV
jgi:cytochrome P450